MKTEIIGGGIVYIAVILGAVLIGLTCKYDSPNLWRKERMRKAWVRAAIVIASLSILGIVTIFTGQE